jgi:hypothetical protein
VREINCLVIHHSASREGSIDLFRAEHKAKGWIDVGYHAVIGNGHGAPDGHIAPGRPPEVVGAGVFGANTGKLHVCLVGNFHRDDPGYSGKPTQAQMTALGRWLLVNGWRYRHNVGGHTVRVSDHRHEAIPGHGTACPGSEFPTGDVKGWYRMHIDTVTGTGPTPDLGRWLEGRGYWHK